MTTTMLYHYISISYIEIFFLKYLKIAITTYFERLKHKFK